jgi:hypothetical protein
MKHILLLLVGAVLFAECSTSRSGVISFLETPDEKKIDVRIDGRPFTAFCYPDNLEKQVLYPIHTASGVEITRGYPLDPRPYERVDHPHHVGMWFNFGNVNGLDFWNNSYAIAPERKHRYGTIRFTGVAEQNPEQGRLVVTADWVNSGDTVLLQERTTYCFSGDAQNRFIERTTELTARTEIIFTENKEGLLGIRMDRAFEEPSPSPVETTGPEGMSFGEKTSNNDGVNGMYRNAQGDTGGAVWGKRSPWVALRAEKTGEIITVAILDHPNNPGYPAWSHARGYGLFASNNLGGRAIAPESETLTFTLQPAEKLVFRHKVILAGDLSDDELNRLAEDFK